MSYRDEVLLIDVFHGDYAAQNCVRKSAEIAARADARIAELEAALRRVRRWCMGDGYSASVQVAMQDWIDGGMVGAMPKLTGLESAIEAQAGNGGEG